MVKKNTIVAFLTFKIFTLFYIVLHAASIMFTKFARW